MRKGPAILRSLFSFQCEHTSNLSDDRKTPLGRSLDFLYEHARRAVHANRRVQPRILDANVGSTLVTNWTRCDWESWAFLIASWERSRAIETMTKDCVVARSIRVSKGATDLGSPQQARPVGAFQIPSINGTVTR
jgi:hypothetical protein